MKIRTWEKVWWGIIIGLMILSLLGVLISKGDIKATINNEVTYWSKSKAALMCVLVYGTIGLVLWLIIKLFTGGFKSEK